MNTEIEAKFVKQDHDEIRARLKNLGAKLIQPERLMVRANYDFPDARLSREQEGWVRIRDEGDKITLSYKQSDDKTLDGMQAVDLVVDSFDKAHDLLQSIGLTKRKAYQETKRESWELDGAQIELDTWPWLSPFVEIEAPSSDALISVAKKLHLDINKALYGSVIPAYQVEYEITPDEMAHFPEYRFSMPLPKFFKERRKAIK